LRFHDALCAYHTSYKTLVGMSPYRHLFAKACQLSIELEHHAFWTIKAFNFDMKQVDSIHWLHLNVLDELCNEAYENDNIL